MEPLPEIIKSSTIPLPEPSSIWKKRLPVVLFGVLILIIILELVWGFQTFILEKQLTQTRQTERIAEVSTPQLVATASKQTYQVGESVPITLKVITGGNSTDSTDVVIRYDPQILEASGSNFITLGGIYKEYPVELFDNNSGIIEKQNGKSPAC